MCFVDLLSHSWDANSDFQTVHCLDITIKEQELILGSTQPFADILKGLHLG
jgi:hypothetical protein